MKNEKIGSLLLVIVVFCGLSACIDDLDTKPLDDESITSATAFDNEAAYKQFLAKVYGSMTLTGQRGEFGMAEIVAQDEGTTSFIRTWWSAQEVTTDEVINAWGDPGLVEFHAQNWSENNLYLKLMYQRIFVNITYCNGYIREVGKRLDGLPSGLKEEVTMYLAEARFMRALYYYYAMDLWGNVPFVTDEDPIGAFLPEQIARADLFDWLEGELNVISPMLAEPGENEYARADRAAAWTLLAKMYLNAEVYTGEDRYTDCIVQCNNIISSGAYSLADNYRHLFLADNHLLRDEIIFTVAEDGNNTRNYGGVTYIINAAVGGQMDKANDYGVGSGGWNGNRMTTAFVNKFADPSGNTDRRANFFTTGQTLVIDHPNTFTEGYLCSKFRNITSNGVIGQHGIFVDTDFPVFRLGDVYLMYAEAILRGGSGGDLATALGYVNELRERAYGDTSGNITSGQLTLPFILDERGRELYWEGHRRTDLVRYGQFSDGNYMWDWKGDVQGGAATSGHLDLFPIPQFDLGVNTNLEQNEGY